MYRAVYRYGGIIGEADTLEEVQQLAYNAVLAAAHGEHSTYYEPVVIGKFDVVGSLIGLDYDLGFNPVIQPEEPECLYGATHDRRHHWEYDDNKRPHGEGFTWSYTCLKCAMIESHDTYHDDGYGGILDDWIAYDYRNSEVS